MRARTGIAALAAVLCAAGVVATTAGGASATSAGAAPATAHERLFPGELLVSGSDYVTDPNVVAGQTVLPPGCVTGCGTAVADGTYPEVFNNDTVDGSFGVTAPIFLDEITPSGHLISRFDVPTSQIVTSFSSKSELALNLSPNGRYVSFMGYATAPDLLDVSNSNTPGVVDPTNPVPGAYYRAVAQLTRTGHLLLTETNAYSGNNGRAAIVADVHGHELIYTAGNAGNGANPQPNGIILGAGAQLITPSHQPESEQTPGTPTPAGSFNITQLGDKPDKIGKDDNFRGLALYRNVLYYDKGSGGNGVDTVYFLDTTGKACPNGGAGLPAEDAQLPTSGLSYNLATLQQTGLPSNMCILKGFPTALAKNTTNSFPFGIWFANASTMYVADEGSGVNTYANGNYTAAAASTTAGLQKWVFDSAAGSWKLAYTLQAGLGLGAPYTVPGYPTGLNPVSGLPWAPATDGLRNITGRVNEDGTVTIWAVTSTVSGSGDQGADPNQLVSVTDQIDDASPAAGELFQPVRVPVSGRVLRGVSLTPGTDRG
jgi:hypothetical protein